MTRQKVFLYAGRLRLRLAPNRGATTLTRFVQENVVNQRRLRIGRVPSRS